MAYKDGRVRVLSWNTHRGEALEHGGLEEILGEFNPNVICLQEAVERRRPGNRFSSIAYLTDHFGADWHVCPDTAKPGSGTYVLAKNTRFDVSKVEGIPIRLGVGTTIEQALARLEDRRTGRRNVVASGHVQALGRGFFNARPGARALHEEHVDAYVQRARRVGPERVGIFAGDWNESFAQAEANSNHPLYPGTALARFAAVGYYPASSAVDQRAHIDEVLYRADDYVKVLSREVFRPLAPGTDHPAVYVELAVSAL